MTVHGPQMRMTSRSDVSPSISESQHQSDDKLSTPSTSGSFDPRGSRLRVGKVIMNARGAHNALKPLDCPVPATVDLAASGIQVADGEEKRVQDELIKMLTGRLAKREKALELLMRQQDSFSRAQSQNDVKVKLLEQELSIVKGESGAKVDSLSRELHQAHISVDQLRSETKSERVRIENSLRQCERDLEVSRSREQHLERQVVDLRRELSITQTERRSVDDRDRSAQQLLSLWMEQANNAESRCIELEKAELRGREIVVELNKQIEVTRKVEEVLNKSRSNLEQEKEILGKRVEQLTRALRGLNARLSDAEKRNDNLSHTESNLTEQLNLLHKNNEELKTSNAQMLAKVKLHKSRMAVLQITTVTEEANLKEAAKEVEFAKERCREYQFRIKQLQEEVQFLSKKAQSIQPFPAASKTEPDAICEAASKDIEAGGAVDGVPVWMRD